MGTYQPCVRNLPLDECIVNINTQTIEIKKQKKGKAEGTHSNDQKPMKSQSRVIWSKQNLQNLVPKDMGNASTQPSKTQLVLKKRQNGLNTTSKAQNAWKQLDPPEEVKAQHI